MSREQDKVHTYRNIVEALANSNLCDPDVAKDMVSHIQYIIKEPVNDCLLIKYESYVDDMDRYKQFESRFNKGFRRRESWNNQNKHRYEVPGSVDSYGNSYRQVV